MARFTRILLGLTAVSFTPGLLIFIGVIRVDAIPSLHVLFPAGVIFFGMSLISRALEKEIAASDAERREHERRLEFESVPLPNQPDERKLAGSARARNSPGPKEARPEAFSSAG